MGTTCLEIENYLEELAPLYLAESWDNPGHMLGNPDSKVNKVLVCIDVTKEVVDEAVLGSFDMIISHHPFIFNAIKNIDTRLPMGQNISTLLNNNICVYSAHTNMDSAESGINNLLAEKIGIANGKIVVETYKEKFLKLVIYVPVSHTEIVRDAICAVGAGSIGNYSNCTFAVTGMGTYTPKSGARPYIGVVSEMEKVQEDRLEAIVSEKILDKALSAALAVHPYEVPAYDIIQLEIEGKKFGLGRVGMLAEQVKFEDFIATIKKTLSIEHLRVAGNPPVWVTKAAAFCGAYSVDLKTILFHEPDIVVTGDLKYHDALDAAQAGLCIIDAGHYATEALILPELQKYISGRFNSLDVRCSISQSDTFKFY